MLTHLLFSISALVFMINLIITYFSYKKNTNSVRSKIYVYMIWFALFLAIVEIIEGVTYVYNIDIIFSLMWKLHSIIMILFVALLFYYFLSLENHFDTIEDALWDSKQFFSIKNLFSIIFVIATVSSIVFVKTYPMSLTMFYFYTDQSINFLLVLNAIYIIYTFYILYLKSKKSNFETNDYIVLFGTFLLFIIALVFEYKYPEISIYSTLFTLVLILIYYFKENEDLLIIEELQAVQKNLYANNEFKINYLNELIGDLEIPLDTFSSINKKLEECDKLTNEEIKESLVGLNCISNNLLNLLNHNEKNRFIKYRVDEMVYNIQEIIKPYMKHKPIEFMYNVDKNIPSELIGDSVMIQRIIMGLLINAIQYTEVGKISLSVTGERIKDGELLKIKVSDTGIGIKKEDFNKVFLNNNRDENDICNLSLTKKCVDLLRGEIHFDSYYGAGSTFYVSIPQGIANELSLLQVPIVRDGIQVKDCNNKKILLIDNEDYSSKQLANILKMYNLDVKCVGEGTEAINTIKCDENYDFIIITDNISDMDFVKTGKLLRQLSNYVKVPPIIALAVLNDPNNNRFDNTFDECLQKPLDLKKLDSIIKNRFI